MTQQFKITTLFLLCAIVFSLFTVLVQVRELGITYLEGMSQALYDSDLQFNTYFDVVFYLAAALAIVNKQYGWILPITILAALNRETSGLIPLMLAVAGLSRDVPQESKRRLFLIAALSLTSSGIIFAGLRLLLGPRELFLPYGQQLGLKFVLYNLKRPITWMQMFGVLGLLPLLNWISRHHWPHVLHSFFWTAAPIWFLIHLLGSIMAEARLFLVPFALLFVPGAMFGLISKEQDYANARNRRVG